MPPTAAAAPHLTPMLRQYLEAKAAHPDAVLLYRMGDFYETFYEDAVKVAPILEVQLTARHRGTDSEAPMCGVPHHALESYLPKLLAAGLKVAICDQVEDAAQAKGLVRREVTRVVTPGTLADPELLESKEDNLLASLVWNGGAEGGGDAERQRQRQRPGGEGTEKAAAGREHGPGGLGAGAFLDVSTGRFFVRRWVSAEEAREDLALYRPREVLVEDGALPALPAIVEEWIEREVACRTPLGEERRFDSRRGGELLARQFGAATLRGFGLEEGEPAVRAAAAALAYAQETQRSDLAHVRGLAVALPGDRLVLDATTLANLEVFRPQRGEAAAGAVGGRRRAPTLLGVLDRTVTPPGGRALREWLRRPLRDPEAIGERHEAVGELVEDHAARSRVREHLGRLGDPERLLARAVLGTMTPREAAALRDGLAAAPGLFAALSGARAPLLLRLAATDPLPSLHLELFRRLVETPAAKIEEGGSVIADGVDAELDTCRSLARDSKRHILALEARERERTGIASLKIRFNRVFGYYLEVTRANQARVPDDYIRRQTLANAERYVTPEIKELEERILAAEERQVALEEKQFRLLLAAIAAAGEGLLALAAAAGTLDALASFAEVAARHRYVRPRVGPPGEPIAIREGRHPVVEQASQEPFVPNDAHLDAERAQIVLLTGPNMGGKSTYLRQVALIVLMAQAGSFVPAEEASLGAVDRIFTRVGASDDLARGESTFMVEMIETANILRHATAESLVVLDEVGRGTATFDGLSLAWAIVEHLHEKGRPKTLFATHYHELTELAALLPRVVNRTMAVKEWEEKILFLRRVVPGSADKSYGLHVARLAGIPAEVVARAGEVLGNLEAQEYDLAGRPRLARGEGAPAVEEPGQLQLFTPPEQVVAALLREVDADRLTPLAALNLVHTLKSRLGG